MYSCVGFVRFYLRKNREYANANMKMNGRRYFTVKYDVNFVVVINI